MEKLYKVGLKKDKQREIVERLGRVISALEKVTSRLDNVGISGYGDRFAYLIGEKVELEAALDKVTGEYVEAQFEISEWIYKVIRREIVASVMEGRYVMLKSYREIAKDIGISERQVYRLHKIGLEELTCQS